MVGGFGHTVVNFLFRSVLTFDRKRGSQFLLVLLKARAGRASSEPGAETAQAAFGVAFRPV